MGGAGVRVDPSRAEVLAVKGTERTARPAPSARRGALEQARRRPGRRPLREGLALADQLHARQLAERARAELLAAGARSRRAAVTGINALTPAEQRVALLALHGDGNAMIAQTLFVTTKTIETHLNRAHRKLGITSRRQLRDVFGPASGQRTSPPTA